MKRLVNLWEAFQSLPVQPPSKENQDRSSAPETGWNRFKVSTAALGIGAFPNLAEVYARNLNRWILPVAVFGKLSTKLNQRGYL